MVMTTLGTSVIASNARADGDLVSVVDNVGNVTTENFASNSGDVLDGCITAGWHKVLRFSFSSRNTGDGAVVAGVAPPTPACGQTCPGTCNNYISGNFIWSDAHCHWHLINFNNYSVYTPANNLIVGGAAKQAFCLMDYTHWNTAVGPANLVYDCGNQGTSQGWEDTYINSPSLACQFVNMDGVTDGAYRLMTTTNSQPTLTETNVHNNTTSIPFTLSNTTVTLTFPGWQSRVTIGGSSGVLTIPSLVSWGPNRLDAFWSDGTNLRHAWYTNGGWAASQSLGHPPNNVFVSGTPYATSWAPNRLDVVTLGSDGKLWHTYWNGTQWGGWDNPGGAANLQSVPTITSFQPNELDIVWHDTSGNLKHIAWWNNAWTSIHNGGHPSSVTLQFGPRSVSWGRNRLDVVALGSDGRLWHNYSSGGTSSFNTWDNPGFVANVSGRPDITSWAPGYLDIAWPNASANAIGHIAWNYTNWSTVDTRAAPAGVTISSGTWPSITSSGHTVVSERGLDIFIRGSDSKLWHLTNNAWGWAWDAPYTNTDVHSLPAAASFAYNQFTAVYGLNSGALAASTLF